MKVRKKPLIVDAWKIIGSPKVYKNNAPDWVTEAYAYDLNFFFFYEKYGWLRKKERLVIKVLTLEGWMDGKLNDYLIRGVNGELYICDKEVFEKTYEIIEQQS
ncbi:hypothetical protein [Enterococcus alishanensis]